MPGSTVGPRFLPFADAATAELPLARLLRLSLFQVSVGMALALLIGTLNRVMIVELGVPAWLVAVMVALPLLFAPFRALIGFRSDTHRSVLGWQRVPYIWIGTLLQFGGLAIMPFALLVLSGDGQGPAWVGLLGAALAFLLVGAGLHTTQTAGLALATDLAPEASRPRVVALLYVMLLVGMALASLAFGLLLTPFTPLRLIQVIQGAALVTMVLNLIALWKQEARNPAATRHDATQPDFRQAWRSFVGVREHRRLLVAVGLGTAAFSMQDILLEPYGGEVLGLPVGATIAADGDARRRRAGGVCTRGAAPAARQRSAPPGRARRARRRRRVRGGDLRRAARLGAAVPPRGDGHRLRRRAVFGRHADRRDGPGAPRPARRTGADRPGARRLGRGAGHLQRAWRSRSAARCATACRPSRARARWARR